MDLLVKAMARKGSVAVTVLVNTATVEKARALHDTYPTATAALEQRRSIESFPPLLSLPSTQLQRMFLRGAGARLHANAPWTRDSSQRRAFAFKRKKRKKEDAKSEETASQFPEEL